MGPRLARPCEEGLIAFAEKAVGIGVARSGVEVVISVFADRPRVPLAPAADGWKEVEEKGEEQWKGEDTGNGVDGEVGFLAGNGDELLPRSDETGNCAEIRGAGGEIEHGALEPREEPRGLRCCRRLVWRFDSAGLDSGSEGLLGTFRFWAISGGIRFRRVCTYPP